MVSENFARGIKFLNDNKTWLILILVLILSIYLRSYHADYPVIGYHNTKEAHTLGEAWLTFTEGKPLVNQEIYGTSFNNPLGEHMDNLPFLSWIFIALWGLFGVKLWLARGVIILFSAGVVLMTYLLVKKLFNKGSFALLSALLVAVCPLLIFFGRNVQYDTPALFFMLASAYLFLCWRESGSTKDFLWFVILFTITGLAKLPFMILLIPLLFIFPYARLNPHHEDFKKYLKQFLYGIFILLIVPLFYLYSKYLDALTSSSSISPYSLAKIGILFTSGFWFSVYTYAITDNFTAFGLWIAILGFFLLVLKSKQWNYRFLAAWLLSYVVYAASSPAQMTGHNYYQMPYAPVIMILVAYAVLTVLNSAANLITPFFKSSKLKMPVVLIGLIIILLLWYPSLKLSTTRQFDTQFYGLDIAGQYVRENSLPSGAIFESGHQDSGLAWHAQRRLAEFNNASDLMRAEKELNVSWVFVYQWGFQGILGNKELKEYIYNHYSLKQVAFIQTSQGGGQPLYFLFKKGGSFNESSMNELLKDKKVYNREYDLTTQKVEVAYINL